MSGRSRPLRGYNGEDVAVINSSDMDNVHTWKGCAQVALVSSLVIVGAMALIIVLVMQSDGEVGNEYGVVFDAGSSHTGLSVYKWSGHDRLRGTAVPVSEVLHNDNDTRVGISFYAEKGQNPRDAGSSLNKLIKLALDAVPSDVRSSTPVYLGATAGMRLVYEVNKTASREIMASVSQVLSQSGFKFADNHAEIILGKEEGAYGWITVNYLKNILQTTTQSLPSVGALDLGGASTQISFVPENCRNATEHFHLYGQDYPVYAKTYLCYGVNEIYRRFLAELAKASNYSSVIPNPCAHKMAVNVTKTNDYLYEAPCSCTPTPSVNHSTYTFYGAMNETECSRQVARLFTVNNTCPKPRIFSRTGQPPLTGHFMAFSGYFYIAKALGLSPSPTMEQFRSGFQKICVLNTTSQALQAMTTTACFAGHYVYALLTEGYGFDNRTWNITFKKRVEDKSVGWSLGYMINATNLIPRLEPRKKLRDEIYIPLLVASAVFILIGLLLCAKFIYSKRRYQSEYNNF